MNATPSEGRAAYSSIGTTLSVQGGASSSTCCRAISAPARRVRVFQGAMGFVPQEEGSVDPLLTVEEVCESRCIPLLVLTRVLGIDGERMASPGRIDCLEPKARISVSHTR